MLYFAYLCRLMKALIATYVATVGFFDGVHRGHRYLIEQVCETAARRGMHSMVITFPVHPRKVLHSDYQPQLLTTRAEKERLLKATGVDCLEWMDFDEALSQLTARAFMQRLYDDYGVRILVVGYDHRFGRGRSEGIEDYVRYGEEIGMEVVRAEELPGGASSTTVRKALESGDIQLANDTLGYAYFLQGQVVHGFHNGTGLGFPTANLQVEPDKLVPRIGAYCVRVGIRQGTGCEPTGSLPGMLNIGNRPTLNNGTERSIEVHLLDFRGDLYGDVLRVDFLEFLRPEQRFLSMDELHSQLEADEVRCREIFGSSAL